MGSHTLLAALNPLDPTSLIRTFGTIGVLAIVFAETGLLVGFFLPGDSLLFTAGLLCTGSTAAGHGTVLSLPQVLIASVVGALAGAQVGYVLGRRAGSTLLSPNRSKRIQDGTRRAQELLEHYGHAKAVVLARFIPGVRTLLNPLAGALHVPVKVFTIWQVAGGLVWSVGLVLAGYALGSSVPNVDKYLLPIIALIVAVSLAPLAVELFRSRRRARESGAG
jgi:membrane-associated protein